MRMLFFEPKFVLSKADGHVPPQGVRSACARGLKLVPKYGGDGLTTGAKSRARNMADGGSVSMASIKRMKAFFARHTEAKTASPPSPGYVAWLLWGGDAGKAWADKMADSGGEACKSLGEGSRGGEVIGHTRSGKPIYRASHATYTQTTPRGAYSPMRDNSVKQNNYSNRKRLLQSRLSYTAQDHKEAQEAHKIVQTIHRDKADKIYEAHTGRSSIPSGNMIGDALGRLPHHVSEKVYNHIHEANQAMDAGRLHYALGRDVDLSGQSPQFVMHTPNTYGAPR